MGMPPFPSFGGACASRDDRGFGGACASRDDRGRTSTDRRNEQASRRDDGMSFGRREQRERPVWRPGQGRNPDLEAEKLTGCPLARDWSEHDDRRVSMADSADTARTRSESSLGGKWKHDLFDS